jgi:hypothetical protein
MVKINEGRKVEERRGLELTTTIESKPDEVEVEQST